VIAYEAWGRIGQAITPSPQRMANVRGLSTHQIFGAAIASSKLLKFDTKQTANALGLAGVSAPVPNARKIGLDDRPLSWTKHNYGWASMGGILAALLTEKGFRGNKHILDGERGFWIMAGSDRCDFEKITRNLGIEYLISDIAFKPYACCRWTHAGLDATASIMAKHEIDVSGIKHIRVQTFSEAVKAISVTNPASILDAQFSLPHLIALELLGKSSQKGLFDNNLSEPSIRSLAEKVSLELHPEIEERFRQDNSFRSAIVSIEQTDGSQFSERVDKPRWEPENRPTKEELRRKFAHLTVPIIGNAASQATIYNIEKLEELEDVSIIISEINHISKRLKTKGAY